MSNKTRDVSAEYRQAELVAITTFDPGSEVVDLPAIRRSSFIQGYAQCLLDHNILRKGTRDEVVRVTPVVHRPEEWGPSDNRRLTCSCGNPDPAHMDDPRGRAAVDRWHLYCKAHEKWRAFRSRLCWLFGHRRHDGHAWVPPDLYYSECRYCGEYLQLIRRNDG